MIISYKWLSEYLPAGQAGLSVPVGVERLSQILTSIGLEVEAIHEYEELKGGLKGLVIGEVLETRPHPNADKLKLTRVNIGNGTPLNIVCGAPNVAAGQKVIVAPVGATIYPINGDPVTMKLAKIRGEESQGMICAEDEIGLGTSHEGILVLPPDVKPGTPAAEYFQSYSDTIIEIGLTPNRMDAMSHWGVARDVCAYLSHHDKKNLKPRLPETNHFKAPKTKAPLTVIVENKKAAPRYSGICIDGVTIAESPKWLQQRLKSIGLKPINNIVDITNFIQYETGQPLHAFDADKIRGQKVIVKNLPEATPFITLDGKERKLSADDLMICDAEGGICIAGVFGGLESGVTNNTRRIFLESAYFDPVSIRKTSFRHGLRTDAATRFEKGTDISATVRVLKRAAALITETCGGELSSDIYDIYPEPQPKKEIALKYHYLKKLSGKNYHPDAVKEILKSLGFEVEKDNIDSLLISVPYHKPDVTLQADVVEEILRIDGLDNVEIPTSIKITPSADENIGSELIKEKIQTFLIGSGHNEILTNSITNKAYYAQEELYTVVKMKNSLSAELNIMRPNMLETGLEVIQHNINRRSENLRLFEFGKTYSINLKGKFEEPEHLCIYLSGQEQAAGWKQPVVKYDFYALKGIAENLLTLASVSGWHYDELKEPNFQYGLEVKSGPALLGKIGAVHKKLLDRFDIKQPVFFADLSWNTILKAALKHKTQYSPVPRFPAVQRDIAMIAPLELPYSSVEAVIQKLNLKKLQSVQLFDVFVNDKLGAGKKSLAVNFTFLDAEKTLTDREIDSWMKKIMQSLERDLQVEIRK
ncbi:phenylalanine--tRNA ligase subunit beta [Niabella ginsenosidivorans]|uniref:Phenylalanine--tRNA ligase beta subunit n=1 Tax=Niabella ginsenosidivorans TaxID=1176587 RepID=A0A1A9I2E8_9BACT|nr:phenylalanine--tRNA ligase subunit beta [Niabella ginsenosidivorans]ANH81505.1 phenylalanine--tRNA ligase subunit beta [Niabella ginsenosidivorans]